MIPIRWQEGVHYEASEGGGFRCLKCGKGIASAPGLGPHLTACYGVGVGAGMEREGAKALPDEYDALVKLLEDHGVRFSKPIADLMGYRGWDDLKALQNYLELSGVRRDRKTLILEAWSRHRGKEPPKSILEERKREEKEGDVFALYDEVTRRELQQMMLEDLRLRLEELLERRRKGLEAEEGPPPYPSYGQALPPWASASMWQQTIAFSAMHPYPCPTMHSLPKMPSAFSDGDEPAWNISMSKVWTTDKVHVLKAYLKFSFTNARGDIIKVIEEVFSGSLMISLKLAITFLNKSGFWVSWS
ncbi:MAG: hypothetical protein QXX95_05065 [Nitrososphaerales archaeon]